MDDDRKFEISSAVGTTVFFISCIGIGSYEEAVHEGYESIHEKLPMETVFTSSLVTGTDCRFSSNSFSWNIVYRLGYFLFTSIERKI